MSAGDQATAGGEKDFFGLSDEELECDYGLNWAEAGRLETRFERLAALPQAVTKQDRAALDKGLTDAASKTVHAAGGGILAAVELGAYLLELKARTAPGGFSGEADRLVPRIGRSMRAKTMKVAALFLKHPAARLEMWAAGSVRAAIGVAYCRERGQAQDSSSEERECALVAAVQRLAILSGGVAAERAIALLEAAAAFMEHASRGVPQARPRSVAARSLAVLHRQIADDPATLRDAANRLRADQRRPNPKAPADAFEVAGEREAA